MNNLADFQNYQPNVNISPSYNNNIHHPRPNPPERGVTNAGSSF